MACAVDESARKFAVAPRDVEDAVPYNARPAALASSPLSACPVPFYPVRYKPDTKIGPAHLGEPVRFLWQYRIIQQEHSARDFLPILRFEKCRNTLCISNFSNRRIGEKYPAKAEEELCGVALYHGASSSPPVDSVGASVGGSVGSGSVGFSVGLSVGLSVGSVGASVGGSVSSTSLATRRLRQS